MLVLWYGSGKNAQWMPSEVSEEEILNLSSYSLLYSILTVLRIVLVYFKTNNSQHDAYL